MSIRITHGVDDFGRATIRLTMPRSSEEGKAVSSLADKAATTTITPGGLIVNGPSDDVAKEQLCACLAKIVPPHLMMTIMQRAVATQPVVNQVPDECARREFAKMANRPHINGKRGQAFVLDAFKEAVDALNMRKAMEQVTLDRERVAEGDYVEGLSDRRPGDGR